MAQRSPSEPAGFVTWIEGLPGSGKSTVAVWLAAKLRGRGLKTEVLDGDEVRAMFSPELGFSRKDRELHARRVSYVARLLARNGVAVLVAMITPYETSRQAARATAPERFTEVWLQCTLEVCRERNPKGIFSRADAHTITKVTGMDDPFEEPLNPDCVVDTSTRTVEQCGQLILDHLRQKGLIPPSAA